MMLLFLVVFIFAYLLSVCFRLAVQHPVNTFKYAGIDTFTWFRLKKYNLCKTGEIVGYVGLFGRGKTLSAVHKVCTMYCRYNDKPVWCPDRKRFVTQKVHIISNVHLTGVPYENFVTLQQIVNAAETNRAKDMENDTLTITLVLGDEFSVQMNSRNFKTNIDPLFLNTILTCRHHHISLYYTAQRFGHVDALLRQVTSYVVDCNKVWRFQCQKSYDAWEMENATNPEMIRPLGRGGFFVTNRDYNAYDTLACVGNLSKSFADGDMLTEEEILALQCNQPANMDVVSKPSRQYLKRRKTK